MQATAFVLEPPLQQQQQEYQVTRSEHWDAGTAMLISDISGTLQYN